MAEFSTYQSGRGGARKGAGRKSHSREYVNESRLALIADGTLLDEEGKLFPPVKVLLYAMKHYFKKHLQDETYLDKAAFYANLAAPYVTPKLAALAIKAEVEHTWSNILEQSFNQETKNISEQAQNSITSEAITTAINESLEDLL